MPTIRSCLEHRHSYVRRNAVMAIFTIFKNFDFLIPDAPELIANFLEVEQVCPLTIETGSLDFDTEGIVTETRVCNIIIGEEFNRDFWQVSYHLK